MRATHRNFWRLTALAAIGFLWVFGCPAGNFWGKITLTVCGLCTASIVVAGVPWRHTDLTLAEGLIGVAAAVALYGLFWAGYALACRLFDFAPQQVNAIYAIRGAGHPWLIGALLLLVTSPGEELFWRGFVQRQAAKRWGATTGVVLGTTFYGAVHLVSGNLMLVLAASVAGLFWCALYRWRGNLTACMVSHALWTVGIFLFFPIR